MRSFHRVHVPLAALVLQAAVFTTFAPLARAQTNAPAKTAEPAESYARAHYGKREVRVPMRDGVELFTSIYVPADTTQELPILLCRTPYGCAPYGAHAYRDTIGPSELFMQSGWIVVYQDVRGAYQSGGTFVDVRPHLERGADGQPRDARLTDEATDTYDTIAWLLANVGNNNGKVGMWGISYPGFYAAAGMVHHHPALVAVSPQAPIADWYFDDFHHHGALFLPHAFNFLARFGRPRPEPVSARDFRLEHGTQDGYQFFLELGPLANVNTQWFHGEVAFWNELCAHPDYDAFWEARNLKPDLVHVAPAVLTVGGWYDAEDLYGALHVYRAIEDQNPGITNTLVMGPWSHGEWARGTGERLGVERFGAPTAEFYRREIELAFFERQLKSVERAPLPEAYVFETGVNRWRTFDAWPPRERAEKSLWLQPAGALAFDPAKSAGFVEYVSDPAEPVPYTEDIAIGMTRDYMTDDQRFAERRPDVIAFQTDVLTEDLTLAGPLEAELWVSTSGTDSDWIVKLVDVLPQDAKSPKDLPVNRSWSGAQRMVRSEVLRGRYRSSYAKPEPFVPGEPARVKVVLQDVLHTFAKGHRVMIQVQSTWFPLVDRNPQTFVKNIFEARAEDFVKATQRVYYGAEHASRVKIGVLAH
jgi:hypothetical protein